MTQIATNKGQSARLIACGVDPESADMCYLYWNESGEQLSREEYLEIFNESFLDGRVELVSKDFGDYDHSYENDSPAWSLSALLALLPMVIRKYGVDFSMILQSYPYEAECNRWCISYYSWELEVTECYCAAPDPIEACVQMIEWLTKNGYKLNNNEN